MTYIRHTKIILRYAIIVTVQSVYVFISSLHNYGNFTVVSTATFGEDLWSHQHTNLVFIRKVYFHCRLPKINYSSQLLTANVRIESHCVKVKLHITLLLLAVSKTGKS